MKNWFPKILISSFLFLLCFTTLLGQNTLDKIGLSNTTLASSAYSLRKMSTAYAGPLARITIGFNSSLDFIFDGYKFLEEDYFY